MNVKRVRGTKGLRARVIINFSFVILLISMIFFVNGFDICNVDINDLNGAFIVNDSTTNKAILVVDSDGDIYLEGKDHTLFNSDDEKSFYITNNLYFNHITSKYNLTLQDQISVIENNSLVIKNKSGISVASFSGNDNNIYTLGKVVANNSQAGCQADGTYCIENTLELRDYYCDLIGSKTGNCIHRVLNSENCLTKLSDDSDGGVNYTFKGTLADYLTCSGSSCTNNTYTDSCSSSTNLLEYFPNGASYNSINYNCLNLNLPYCVGTVVYTTNNLCADGACYAVTSTPVQSCTASTTQYGSWTCKDIFTRTQIITTYAPTCSVGVCGQSTTHTQNDVSCAYNQMCSNGACSTSRCTLDGITKSYGETYTFYRESRPTGLCTSQVRTCQRDGTFSGDTSFSKASCLNGCTGTPWGSVASGFSGTAYSSSTSHNCGANSQTRTCTNGVLSGSYGYTSCGTIVDCSGYWDNNAGSCSVSCGGGGNYDRQWITLQHPQNGGVACPSPTWYDNGGNSCGMQACSYSISYEYHFRQFQNCNFCGGPDLHPIGIIPYCVDFFYYSGTQDCGQGYTRVQTSFQPLHFHLGNCITPDPGIDGHMYTYNCYWTG